MQDLQNRSWSASSRKAKMLGPDPVPTVVHLSRLIVISNRDRVECDHKL